MTSKQVILGALAALILAAAVWQFARRDPDAASENDFPQGTFWLCRKSGCDTEFIRSIDELAAFYRDNPQAPLPCPDCGQADTVRADRCPSCGRHFVLAIGATPTCPHCMKNLPRLTDRTKP